jgi:hypothetical protein
VRLFSGLADLYFGARHHFKAARAGLEIYFQEWSRREAEGEVLLQFRTTFVIKTKTVVDNPCAKGATGRAL